MNRNYIAIIIALIILTGAYVLTQNNNAPTTPQKTQQVTNTSAQEKLSAAVSVGFLDFEIVPVQLDIAVNTTVNWTNYGDKPQIVNGIGFKSQVLQKGESYAHTFNEPGVYTYVSDLRDFAVLNATINVK